MISLRRSLAGSGLAVAGIAVLSAVMIPLRSHLSIATPALILVVPVVLGVIVGGFAAGGVAVVLGFLAYDFYFIPPFGTLNVGAGQDWVALAVYAAVMLAVAQVVSVLQRTRRDAARRETETRRLYELSELLIGEKPLPELLQLIASTVQRAFGPRWVAVLLPTPPEATLTLAATAGEPLTDDERRHLSPVAGRRETLGSPSGPAVGIERVVLVVAGRPVGLLATSGTELDRHDAELLRTYANHAALALERSQLRSQALRSELLEEVDRWRGAMMGAVSHDLRTPLASVKTAVSMLRTDVALDPSDQDELLELIEVQSDRLARLVTNLLDMTRIEAGALELRPEICSVAELVDDAVATLGTIGSEGTIVVDLPDDLPAVDVDRLLMVQVLTNLLENATRFSPPGASIEVSARSAAGRVELAVQDHGPGIAPGDREQVFLMFNRISGGGRAGLGLTIAKAFVEAHHQHIRVEDTPGGGARLVVTLAPAAATPELAERARLVQGPSDPVAPSAPGAPGASGAHTASGAPGSR